MIERCQKCGICFGEEVKPEPQEPDGIIVYVHTADLLDHVEPFVKHYANLDECVKDLMENMDFGEDWERRLVIGESEWVKEYLGIDCDYEIIVYNDFIE